MKSITKLIDSSIRKILHEVVMQIQNKEFIVAIRYDRQYIIIKFILKHSDDMNSIEAQYKTKTKFGEFLEGHLQGLIDLPLKYYPSDDAAGFVYKITLNDVTESLEKLIVKKLKGVWGR